jgi:hypothetical protein
MIPVVTTLVEAQTVIQKLALEKRILEDTLITVYNTVADVRVGFAPYVRPDAWVDQLQAHIKSGMDRANS